MSNAEQQAFLFPVSRARAERFFGVIPEEHDGYYFCCDKCSERLRKGMAVCAYFDDGSGPVTGIVRSRRPENRLIDVIVDIILDDGRPGGYLSFRRKRLVPITGLMVAKDFNNPDLTN